MKRLPVHIDRLLLKGVRHEDRHAIAERLQHELGRLLAEPGVARRLATTTDTARLKTATVRVAWGKRPVRLGTFTARNIVREFKS
jgi:hypothetical protein